MNVSLTRLADVEPEQVSWLWPGYIPLGKLVNLDGDPGLGKSTLALTIAAIVSRGGEWPDGTRCAYPGDVLVMSAEDGTADTIRPRLDAAGADVKRVHTIDGHGAPDELAPVLLSNTEAIRQAITETEAKLLIVDVLMAFLTGDAHKDQDVRRVLGPLARVADETACTVILVRHLNKSRGGDPLYRGGGSIGIAGAARSGLAVVADPDDAAGMRVLVPVKNNLAPPPKSWAFTLVPENASGVDTSRVEWVGEDGRAARELFAATDDADEHLGDMSNEVLKLVESQPETRSGDVSQAFSITSKAGNQYLRRLCKLGKITNVGRGRYGPVKSSAVLSEDIEDSEDSTGQGYERNVPEVDLNEGLDAIADRTNPHYPHNLHAISGDDSRRCATPHCGGLVAMYSDFCSPCSLAKRGGRNVAAC